MAEATHQRASSFLRAITGVAAAVVVAAGVRAAAGVFVPLLIALVTTAVVDPLQRALARRWHRPGAAFLVTAGGVTVGMGTLVWLTYVALADFLASLPAYDPALRRLVPLLWDASPGLNVDLQTLTSAPPPDPEPVLRTVAAVTRGLLSGITGGWAIVLLATLFMLYEARTFPDKLARALKHHPGAAQRILGFGGELGRYMGVLTFTNALVGIGNGIVLLALGVPGALLWAALSALFSYIPDIGFIVSVIPPTVATALHAGPGWALVLLLAFVVINGVIDEIVFPRLVGKELDIAPFWTLVSLLFWGWLLGIAGAVLAIPLTMLAKLALESFPETRELGGLLSAGGTRRHRRWKRRGNAVAGQGGEG